MAAFDLVIRNGEVHDGNAGDPFTGDVAIKDGRIAAVGKVSGAGSEEIDARGKIVTPGFIDVHTHYDGQATWENRMVPSSNHGVTTVVTGNCGVGFAPCRPEHREVLIELMEGVEDVPEVVMAQGLPWNWETLPDYLDALAVRQFDVDVGVQAPHSALRVYVMGERALRRQSGTKDELAQMQALTTEAVRAGALGVSTSRSLLHRTRSGDLAPSLNSDEAELLALARGLREAGSGVFQLIPQMSADIEEELALIRRIAEESQRPVSFTLSQSGDGWRKALRVLEDLNAQRLKITGQIFPRPIGALFGLDLSFHPFSFHPSFQPIADLPLVEKLKVMRDPAFRAKLLSEDPNYSHPTAKMIVQVARQAYVMGDPPNYTPAPDDQVLRRAEAAGRDFDEYMYDLLLEDEGSVILCAPTGNLEGDLRGTGEMLAHPNTVIGLGDGGAHYGIICDASWPTFYLERWVRDRTYADPIPLEKAVRDMTRDAAKSVGLEDRGLLAPGYLADINVIDLDGLRLHRPTVVYDLPAGGRRLRQNADGYVATVKSGRITYRQSESTGLLPGRLVRWAQPAPV